MLYCGAVFVADGEMTAGDLVTFMIRLPKFIVLAISSDSQGQ